MVKLLLIPVAFAALIPAPTAKAAIGGPKVFFIAMQGHGEAMSPAFTYSGFGETPAFDAHTNAQGVDIRDVVADDGKLRFSVSYSNTAPNNFEVIVYATNGQGTALERHRVEVRRSN
jgi:hypothetical protein